MTLPSEKTELRPHWHRIVLAAHLRNLGLKQQETAIIVGRSVRTIHRWETDEELWRQARAESLELFDLDLSVEARATLLRKIRAGDVSSAKWWLERTEEKFSPPEQRHEVAGAMMHGVVVLPPLDTGLESRPLKEVLASSKLEQGNSDGPPGIELPPLDE